jgi:hypothetical protein
MTGESEFRQMNSRARNAEDKDNQEEKVFADFRNLLLLSVSVFCCIWL